MDNNPFSYHRPNEYSKKIFIGKTPREYKEEFIKNYKYRRDPFFTSIVGSPGSGKTHFIYYLKQILKDDHIVIIELKDELIESKDIINEVYLQLGFIDISSDRIKKSKEIKNKLKDNESGLIICVDEVDEHIRKIELNSGRLQKETIKNLFGAFRLIFEDFNKLCILFSLTEDVNKNVEKALRADGTLKRRFHRVNDTKGSQIVLGKIGLDDAKNMVAAYMKEFQDQNNKMFPKGYKECIYNEKNLYPFTNNIVELLWSASDEIPGFLSFGCAVLWERWKEKSVMSSEDAAWGIKHYSNFFGGYEKNTELQRKVDDMLRGHQIENELERIANQASRIHINPIESLIDNLGKFFKILSEKFFFKKEYNYKLIKNRLSGKIEETYLLNLIIEYNGTKIGIQIIDAGEKNIRIQKEDLKALATALINQEVNRGIIIVLNRIDDPLEDHWMGIKGKNIRNIFNDHGAGVDYISVVYEFPLRFSDMWSIIGLVELVESSLQRRFAQKLDEKIGLEKTIKQLVEIEYPKPEKRKTLNPKDILNRPE